MSMRQSRQRDVVLELVRSTMDHPTADWVYRQARRRLPRISLATVYRNLKRLAAEGVIREVQSAGQARFDCNLGRRWFSFTPSAAPTRPRRSSQTTTARDRLVCACQTGCSTLVCRR